MSRTKKPATFKFEGELPPSIVLLGGSNERLRFSWLVVNRVADSLFRSGSYVSIEFAKNAIVDFPWWISRIQSSAH